MSEIDMNDIDQVRMAFELSQKENAELTLKKLSLKADNATLADVLERIRDEIDSLRSQLKASHGIQWKPVCEKPKSGVDIFISDGDTIHESFYEDGRGFYTTDIPGYIPTHWAEINLPESEVNNEAME